MQLGLVSVSFRKNSPEEIINATKAAGLTCIEWGSDVHAPYTDEMQLKRIATIQQSAGITCCSYGTYFYLGRDDISELHQYIKAAKYLGTNILRLWCGTKGSKEYSEEDLVGLYLDCSIAAKIAEQSGVILCMESHNNTLTDSKESALALMKAINSPSFRMYWQPNQFCTTEENLAYASLLAPYTYHVHVFNWNYLGGEILLRSSLSESVETWKAYMKHLTGNHTMLLEFMPDDNINSLRREADALKSIVREGE